MVNKTKKSLVSILLLSVLLITEAFAVFTTTDAKHSIFSMGGLKISLNEAGSSAPLLQSSFFNNDMSDTTTTNLLKHNILSFGEDVGILHYADKKIIKQPYVTNESQSSAYVFAVLGIPTISIKDTTINLLNIYDADQQEGINKTWSSLGTVKKELVNGKDNYCYYLYMYNTAVEPNENTTNLFDYVAINENDCINEKNFTWRNGRLYLTKDSRFTDVFSSDDYICDMDMPVNAFAVSKEEYEESENTGYAFWINTFSSAEYVDKLFEFADEERTVLKSCKNYEVVAKIPDTVTQIQDNAFKNCNKLLGVIIPETVTAIGNYAFYGCSSMEELNIPKNITSIGVSAFENCKGLNKINFNAIACTDLSNDSDVFKNAGENTDGINIVIGSKVEAIPNCLFSNSNLNSLSFEENSICESIGIYAFANCSSLNEITIGENISHIGNGAFKDCCNLTVINYNAINCGNLEKNNKVFSLAAKDTDGLTINIGNKVEIVPSYLFNPDNDTEVSPKVKKVFFETGSSCETLSNYSFAYGNQPFDFEYPDCYCIIGDYTFYCSDVNQSGRVSNITNLKEWIEKDKTENEIKNAVYNGTAWRDITEIEFPANITAIGKNTFRECEKLTSVVIPNTIEIIKESAFESCNGLTTITLGSNIQTIENKAFYNCKNVNTINYNAVNCADLDQNNNVFYGVGYTGIGIKVNIGNNVISVPAYLFNPCNNTSSAPQITDICFSSNSNCSSINAYAFAYNNNLISNNIQLPDCDCTVSASAFYKTTYNFVFLNDSNFGEWISLENNNSEMVLLNGKNIKDITTLIIPNGVTEIAAKKFQNFTKLQSVIISDDVTTIGANAFYNCTALKSLTIGKSVTAINNFAFDNCTALEEINYEAEICNDINYNDNVFRNAGQSGNGINVNFSSNVKAIPSYLFYAKSMAAPRIKKVLFEKNSQCTTIGEYSICTTTKLDFYMPDIACDIDEDVVKNYSSEGTKFYITDLRAWLSKDGYIDTEDVIYQDVLLSEITEIEIPEDITRIGSYALFNCKKTEKINIPNSVTEIGSYAFAYCQSLKEINIPNSVIDIGKEAFFECTNANTITIGKNVTNIGNQAFSYCTKVETINYNAIECNDFANNQYIFYKTGSQVTELIVKVGNQVKYIPSYLFCGTTSNSNNINDITFVSGSQCSEIHDYAFAYNTKLNNTVTIFLPDCDCDVDEHAFEGCNIKLVDKRKVIEIDDFKTWIETDSDSRYIYSYNGNLISSETIIEIPEGTTRIGKNKFYDCNLRNITIPESVTEIGENAFYNCKILSYVIFEATNCADCTVDNKIFYNCGQSGYGFSLYISQNVVSIPDNLFTPCDDSNNYPKITEIDYYNTTQISELSYYISAAAIREYVVDFSKWVEEDNLSNFTYYLKDKTLLSKVTDFVIPEDVKKIGASRFSNFTNLSNITIPKSVKEIGISAFYNCTALEEINYKAENCNNLSVSNNVFYRAGQAADGITVNVGKNVSVIPQYLFNPCNDRAYSPNIMNVICETDSVATTICSYSFAYGYSALTVKIGNLNSTIDKTAFYKTGVTIIYDVTDLKSWVETEVNLSIVCCYKGSPLKNMTTIEIPSGTQKIADSKFADFSSLSSVRIPDSVTEIGMNAFSNCSSLKSLTIGEGVTTINECAFYNCTALEQIHFNAIMCSDLTTSNAFYACGRSATYGITITIGEKVTRIPARLFLASADYCPKIASVNFAEGSVCTSIGEYAFANNGYSTNVYYPMTHDISDTDAYNKSKYFKVYRYIQITDIKDWIERDHTEAEVSTNHYVYQGQDIRNITDFEIPDGITTIGVDALREFYALTTLTIPESVSEIKTGRLNGITTLYYNAKNVADLTEKTLFKLPNLESLYIGNMVKTIPAYMFYISPITSLLIPDNVTTIGEFSFYNCKNLTDLTIGTGVSVIGRSAFQVCTSLQKIYYNAIDCIDCSSNDIPFFGSGSALTMVIGNEVTHIPAYLFYSSETEGYSPNLKEVKFETNSNCSYIGEKAFYLIKSSFNFYYPDCYFEYDENAFISSNVTFVGTRISEGLTKNISTLQELREWVEANYTIGEYKLYGEDISQIESITIPDGTIKIGNNKFSAFVNLKEVQIPSSVSSIGSNAFRNCSSLKTINIPNSTVEIGSCAFQNCTGLTTITIPVNCEKINTFAFDGCTNLTEVKYNAKYCKVSSTGYIFNNCGNSDNGITITIGNTVENIDPYTFYDAYIKMISFESGGSCKKIEAKTINSKMDFDFYLPDFKCDMEKCAVNGSVTYNITNIASWAASDFNDRFSSVDELTTEYYYNDINIEDITDITLEEGTTTILAGKFSRFTNLKSIVISNTIETIGNYAFYKCTSLTDVTIGENVTTIGYYLFSECSAIKNINYNAINANTPNGLNSMFSGIGDNKNPVRFIIGNKVKYLQHLAESVYIDEVVFSEHSSCERIFNYTFKYCNSFVFYYPDCECQIDKYAFGDGQNKPYFRKNINNVREWLESDSELGDDYYYNGQSIKAMTSFEIPEGTTKIGAYKFKNCINLTSMHIPESVVTIADNSFMYCYQLSSIEFESYKAWLSSALYIDNDYKTVDPVCYCNGVEITKDTTITIPDGTTIIANNKCQNFTNITELNIPNSVEKIGNNAFYGCSNLRSVKIFSADIVLGQYVFGDSGVKDMVLNASEIPLMGKLNSLETLTIGKDVQNIVNQAFSNTPNLETINFNASCLNDVQRENHIFSNSGSNATGITVNIGKAVTYIPANLFNPYNSYYAPKIISLSFEDNCICNSVNNGAFANCILLQTIELPVSITNIGNNAFYNCILLSTINYNAKECTDLGEGNNAFYRAGISDGSITINIGSQVKIIPDHLFNPCNNEAYAPFIAVVKAKEATELSSIGNYSLAYNNNSIRVYTPAGGCNISDTAFYNSQNLKTSHYINNLSRWIEEDSNLTEFGVYNNIDWQDIVTSDFLIPNVTKIGANKFLNTNIKNIYVPNTVTYIGKRAFENCNKAETLNLGSGVILIEAQSFKNCSSLKSLTIPIQIKTIRNSAFENCMGIEEISYNAIKCSNTTVNNNIFKNVGKNSSTVELTIGNQVKQIPTYMFNPCNNSKYAPNISVVIFKENSCCSLIGSYSFAYNNNLHVVNEPDCICDIATTAYTGCENKEA